MAIFLYIFVALSLSAHPIEAVHGQWCVADPQAPASLLQGALDWACGAGGADCSAIQWNQPCFMPNTLASHASYAFNIYWQKAKHRGASCHFNAAAFVTETNPRTNVDFGCVNRNYLLVADAVDGKQARRTNSSSPLGELFDHGCDALTCAFESMAFGSSVMSGRHTIWFWVIAAVPFYCATWERLVLYTVTGGQCYQLLLYCAALMYVLVPMPCLFFGGGDTSFISSTDGGGWVDLAKFLTGASAIGSIAIPAILRHAKLIELGAMLIEFSSFFVFGCTAFCFYRMNNEEEYSHF